MVSIVDGCSNLNREKVMKWLIVLLAVALAGCGGDVSPKSKSGGGGGGGGGVNNGGGGTGDAGMGADSGTEMEIPDDTKSSPDAPDILELSATPMTLTNASSVVLNAVVTDPDGPEDIAAGRVLEASTSAVLGTFASSGGGAYSFELQWNTLSNAIDLTFEGQQNVVLTIEFIDAANERSTRSLSLQAACDEGGPACGGTCGETFCDGICEELSTFDSDPNNCGGCGIVCEGGVCEESACVDIPKIDGACTTVGDCETGADRCLPPDSGIAGGWCIFECSSVSDCGTGTTCGAIGTAESNIRLCLRECETVADCPRDDWTCMAGPNLEGQNIKVCLPPLPQ